MLTWAALLLISVPAPAGETETSCPETPAEFVTIAGVSTDGEITLADGRTVRVAGLEPPRATPAAPNRSDVVRRWLQDTLGSGPAGLATLGAPDRWGAVPGVLFAFDGTDIGPTLLSRGDQRVQPDGAAHPCMPTLLQAERGAREMKAGVWADPLLAVADADSLGGDDEPVAMNTEGMVIVEGTVGSVGETSTRLFINLGRRRGGFAISVAKRDKALMDNETIRDARKVGARLRVRGLLDRSMGLRMDLTNADALEIVSTASSGSAATASQR